MLRSPAIRLLLVLIVCLAMPVAFGQAQIFGNMSPVSTGEAVAILVGAGAAIGIVVYLVIPKQKTIAGCVETADNGLRMTKDQMTSWISKVPQGFAFLLKI